MQVSTSLRNKFTGKLSLKDLVIFGALLTLCLSKIFGIDLVYYIIIVPVAMIILLVSFKYPRLAILVIYPVIIHISSVLSFNVGRIGISPERIIIGVALLGHIFFPSRGSAKENRLSNDIVFGIIFLNLAYIASTLNNFTFEGIEFIVGNISKLTLLYLTFTYIKSVKDLDILVKYHLIGAVFPLLAGIYFLFQQDSILALQYVSTLVDFNNICDINIFYLVRSLRWISISWWSMFIKLQQMRRFIDYLPFFSILIAVMLFTVLYIARRELLISAVLGILVILITYYGKNRRAIVLLMIPIIIITLHQLSNMNEQTAMQSRMIESLDYGFLEKDDVRLILSKASWNIFLESPIIGHGAHSFRELMRTKQSHLFPGIIPAAHNDLTRIAVETGLIGILSYVLFICGIVIKAIKCYTLPVSRQLKPYTKILIVLILQILIWTTVVSCLPENIFWFWCGIVLGIAKLAEEDVARSTRQSTTVVMCSPLGVKHLNNRSQ